MKFWERSEKYGKGWETIFERIDPDVRFFAKQHNMKITPWPWDAPEEILTWSSKGVHKNLRLYIEEEPEPYAVKFSGAAWVDQSIEDRRDRLAYYEQFEPSGGIVVKEPTKAFEVGLRVRGTLEAAFKTVDSWDYNFLRDSFRNKAKEAKRVSLAPWPVKTKT